MCPLCHKLSSNFKIVLPWKPYDFARKICARIADPTETNVGDLSREFNVNRYFERVLRQKLLEPDILSNNNWYRIMVFGVFFSFYFVPTNWMYWYWAINCTEFKARDEIWNNFRQAHVVFMSDVALERGSILNPEIPSWRNSRMNKIQINCSATNCNWITKGVCTSARLHFSRDSPFK